MSTDTSKFRDRSTLRRSGPCFKCREQTLYGDGSGRGLCYLHLRYGDEWLDRAFANGFTRMTSFGRRRGHGPYPTSYMKPYLCARCRHEMNARERAAVEQARQRKAEEDARARFEKTWRKPEPGEFPDEQGEKREKRFLVVEEGFGYQEIVFRFRITKRWCVGHRAVWVYAMFVNGKLEARTYHDSGDEENDPIAGCFSIWFQNRWQDRLSASKHATDIWYAKDPHRSRLDSWGGFSAGLEDCPSWSLVHTVWADGSVYAAVEDMRNFESVTDFAATVLDAQVVPITKGASVIGPVHHSRRPPPVPLTPATRRVWCRDRRGSLWRCSIP